MLVSVRVSFFHWGQVYHPGDRVEMDDKVARSLERAGFVEVLEPVKRKRGKRTKSDGAQGRDQTGEGTGDSG